MKAKIRFILWALFALALIPSCKEDDNPKIEESPFFSFFDQPAITIDNTAVSESNSEYGLILTPLTV